MSAVHEANFASCDMPMWIQSFSAVPSQTPSLFRLCLALSFDSSLKTAASARFSLQMLFHVQENCPKNR